MGVRRRTDAVQRTTAQRQEAARIGAWWRKRARTGQPLTPAEYARLTRLEAFITSGWAATLDYYEPTLHLPDRDPVRVSITAHRARSLFGNGNTSEQRHEVRQG